MEQTNADLALKLKKRILGAFIALILIAGLIIGIFFLIHGTGGKKEWTLDELKKEENIFVVDILFKKTAGAVAGGSASDPQEKEDLINKYLKFESNDGDVLSFHPLHNMQTLSGTCTRKSSGHGEADYDPVTIQLTVNGLSADSSAKKLSLGSEYSGVPVTKDKDGDAVRRVDFKVKFKETMKKDNLVDKLLKSIETNAGKLPALGKSPALDVVFFDLVAELLEKEVQDLEWAKEQKPSEEVLKRKEAQLKNPTIGTDIDKLTKEIADLKKKLGK